MTLGSSTVRWFQKTKTWREFKLKRLRSFFNSALPWFFFSKSTKFFKQEANRSQWWKHYSYFFRNSMSYLFAFRFFIASRFQYSSLLIQVRFSKNASSKLVDLIDKNKSRGNKEICALRPQKALRMRHEIHIFDKSLAEDLWPFKWTTINATPWTVMRRNVEFSLRFFALFFLFQDFVVRRRQWKQVMKSIKFLDARASIGLSTSSTFADPLLREIVHGTANLTKREEKRSSRVFCVGMKKLAFKISSPRFQWE